MMDLYHEIERTRIMNPIFIRLFAEDGKTIEALAMKKRRDGSITPEGFWIIEDPIKSYVTLDGEMAVDDMPPHWQTQINKAIKFGRNLS